MRYAGFIRMYLIVYVKPVSYHVLFIYEQTGYVLVTVKSVMMSGLVFALSTICRKDMLGFPYPHNPIRSRD